jgi:hypothetical protein
LLIAGALEETVIASEAKQSRAAKRRLDCFVASLLAMTTVDGRVKPGDDEKPAHICPAQAVNSRKNP